MKRINPSDVVVVPYQANKQVELTYSNLPNVCQEPVSTDVKILTGKNLSGTFNKETDPKTNGQYQRLVYDSINNLYYKNNSFSYKWNRETKEKALLLVEHWLYKYSD